VGGAASDPGLPNSTAWLGCVYGRQALMGGEVVGLLDGVSSEEACCRRCRQFTGGTEGKRCNVFNFCPEAAECR